SDPLRIELQTSHDGGKTVAERQPITLPGLSSEDNLQPCDIPWWDASTMYAVGLGPSGAAGFYLSRNTGQTWSWRAVRPEQRPHQSVRLYVHPSIPGKAYLLSSPTRRPVSCRGRRSGEADDHEHWSDEG